jgi:hypothetical protein
VLFRREARDLVYIIAKTFLKSVLVVRSNHLDFADTEHRRCSSSGDIFVSLTKCKILPIMHPEITMNPSFLIVLSTQN